MEGHQVPPKIWTYTLSHYIKLRGMVPHGELELSPDELVYRNRPNDGSLKIFSCRVYIRPPGKSRKNMDNHIKNVIFIGYTTTSYQIYHLGMDTNMVKTSNNLRFYEGINDVEITTPNYRHLRIALGKPLT